MSVEGWLWISLGLCASFAAGVAYGVHVCYQHTRELFKTWRDNRDGT